MSELRPELVDGEKPATMTRYAALVAIRKAVARRRSLCHGQLDDGEGHHCALGWFWEDNPGQILPTAVVDEVAAINDAVVPSLSNKDRWRVVKAWLVEQVGW